MLAGILIGIVVSVLMETLAAVGTGVFGKFMAQDFVIHIFPVAVGIASFAALQMNKGIHAWGDEVVTEIRRVVWPSRKETVAMTIVVCVMLVISGLLFGLLDVTSGALVNWLQHQNLSSIFG